jgi:hypothetical protein
VNTKSTGNGLLDLLDGDSSCGADLDTGLATEAVILTGDHGFFTVPIIYFRRARIHTLFIALAFVIIDGDLEHGFLLFIKSVIV